MRVDRRLILGGVAILLALVLAVQLWSGGEPAPEPVPVAAPPVAPPPPVATATPPAAPAVSPEGLRLFGVTGAGAIIGMPDGRQRLVMLGREVLPGLRLEVVRVDHAMLKSPAGDYRLDFTGVTAATPSAPAPAPASGPASEAAIRADVRRYQLGLEPRQAGGRITSHVVRPGQDLPVLRRAGLQPGDVILRVNDSEFDQERMMELAWTIANTDQVVFEIERNGQRMRLATQGGQAR